MTHIARSFLFTLFLVAASGLSAHAQTEIVVIANPGVKASTISKSDVRDIFTGGASVLKDGSHVVPILLNKGTVNEEFLKAYIGKSDEAYRTSWRSLVFSGQATMPKSLESDAAAVEFVLAHPGAIAYIAHSTPHAGVKVLTVK